MNKTEHYLGLLQSNICRYGWQSFGTKMVAALIATTFLVLHQTSGTSGEGHSIALAFAVVICFILWLADGHYSASKDVYADLYKKTMTTSEHASMKVQIAKTSRLNVAALWSPLTIVFYMPVLGMLLFLVLR